MKFTAVILAFIVSLALAAPAQEQQEARSNGDHDDYEASNSSQLSIYEA